jgi:hypothetical protein
LPFIGYLNEEEIAWGYFEKMELLHTQLMFPTLLRYLFGDNDLKGQ